MNRIRPQFAKEQLLEAGLVLAQRWWNELEFQALATWPQRHFGANAETEIHRKAMQVQECIKLAASELKSILLNHSNLSIEADPDFKRDLRKYCNEGISFAEDLISFSDPLFSTLDYFLPAYELNLLSDCRSALHQDILDGMTTLPNRGNIPAVCFLLRLATNHCKLYEAWQLVFGLKHVPPRAFQNRLDELQQAIAELRVLCLGTLEARMSAFAMTLVQLLNAVGNNLDLSWLDLPAEIIKKSKPRLERIVESDLASFIHVVSAGMPEFINYLKFIPTGQDSPRVQEAIATGKMVVDIPGRRVFFKGTELTNMFEKTAFNTLVLLCRAIKQRGLINVKNYSKAKAATFRGRYLRLGNTHESLAAILPGGDGAGNYPLTLKRSELLIIEKESNIDN